MNDLLPKHVEGHLQEHTGGGYLLLRVNSQGEVIYDCDFDTESQFFSVVSKGEMILGSLLKHAQESVYRSLDDEPEEPE